MKNINIISSMANQCTPFIPVCNILLHTSLTSYTLYLFCIRHQQKYHAFILYAYNFYRSSIRRTVPYYSKAQILVTVLLKTNESFYCNYSDLNILYIISYHCVKL
jgi:hypothetical protein